MAEALKTTKKRNGNIELLRLLCMLMVISLHALGKGNNLDSLAEGIRLTPMIAWLFESMSIVAVNTFMLISGYFLVNSGFKSARVIELILQAVFYSFGTFLIVALMGFTSFSDMGLYELLTYLFPIHMGTYWFVTAYLLVYILSPLLNKAVKGLEKKQLEAVIVLLLIYECLLKTILPIRLETDTKGYNMFWFIIVYLIGAYLRQYGFRYLTSSKRGLICYYVFAALIFVETVSIYIIVGRTGHLSEIKGIPMEYNHLFNILASIGLFAAFLNRNEMDNNLSGAVCRLSPMALGIYLFHESPILRYQWQILVHVYEISNLLLPIFLIRYLFGILLIFAVGLLVDYVRMGIFSLVGGIVKKTGLAVALNKFDGMINGLNDK